MQGSIKYRCEGMYEGKACYLLVTYFAKPKTFFTCPRVTSGFTSCTPSTTGKGKPFSPISKKKKMNMIVRYQ